MSSANRRTPINLDVLTLIGLRIDSLKIGSIVTSLLSPGVRLRLILSYVSVPTLAMVLTSLTRLCSTSGSFSKDHFR